MCWIGERSGLICLFTLVGSSEMTFVVVGKSLNLLIFLTEEQKMTPLVRFQ
jgi:hypothetical protein